MSSTRKIKTMGGEIYPRIDASAFPFEDSLGVPITIKEQRYDNYTTVSNLNSATSLKQQIRLEWDIPNTTDSSMYDLHNSFFQFQITVPTLSANQGIAQFGVNNMVLDSQIFFGSTLVSDPHNGNLYPYQAMVSDLLTEKRPCSLSLPAGSAQAPAGANNDVSMDALTEGSYLGYSLTTNQSNN